SETVNVACTVAPVPSVTDTSPMLMNPLASYEPESQAEPAGRGEPRWSAAGGGQPLVTRSRAGLLPPSARVCVGPPLFASGPSCGWATSVEAVQFGLWAGNCTLKPPSPICG